ncbi:hypothetical protein ACU4IU_00045 [Brevibacterium sp. CSND-B09]|uniref:hypothetical protein n=1 Tax=Brevibacterium sp. CSND-B09 TaxID=3462571 RepID=UPI00406A72CB
MIEQAMDLLNDEDYAAVSEALRSSMFASKTIHLALASDGAVSDAGRVPSADSIYKYRTRKGWL